MISAALKKIQYTLDHISSSLLIGYAIKIACLAFVNTILSLVLLSPISALPYLNLYFLHLCVMLPKARKYKDESKIEIVKTITHLLKKLFSLNHKVSSFINSTFTGAAAAALIIFMQGNLILAAPTLLSFFLGYVILASYSGKEFADTLFDLRVLAVSVACGFAMTLLTGVAHHIFLAAYALFTIAAYIHINESHISEIKYSISSIIMLTLSLLSPIVAACQYITCLTPIVTHLQSPIASFMFLGSNFAVTGHATKQSFEQKVTVPEVKTHVQKQDPSGDIPSPDAAATAIAA
ncbi:hypothetical protein OAT84_01105 [Gammaproteobacteria bacterium]|nr:hypothetical protein [Gammaproteobacteria bacterium]